MQKVIFFKHSKTLQIIKKKSLQNVTIYVSFNLSDIMEEILFTEITVQQGNSILKF